MSAVLGVNTEAAGVAESAQVNLRPGLLRPFRASAGPIGRLIATSFRTNWRLQLAGLAASTDSDRVQTSELAKTGNSVPRAPAISLDRELEQGSAFSSPLISGIVAGASQKASHPAVLPNIIETQESGNPSTIGAWKGKLQLKHVPRTSTFTLSTDKALGRQASDAHGMTNFSLGHAIDCVQANSQSVQVPSSNLSSMNSGQKQVQIETSDHLSTAALFSTGQNERTAQLVSTNSFDPFSSDQASVHTNSNVKSVTNFSPADEDSAFHGKHAEASPSPLAESSSRQPILRSIGITTSAQNAAQTPNAVQGPEQRSHPSEISFHHAPSRTDSFSPAQSVPATSASQHFGAETARGQWPNQDMSPFSFRSEPTSNAAPASRQVARDAAKIDGSKANLTKPTAQSLPAFTAHTQAASGLATSAHDSLERANSPLSAGPEMTPGASSIQQLADPLPRSIDSHRITAAHAAGDTFDALDSTAHIPDANWGPVSARRAEAGFQDSSLGWIGIRAEINGGAVHATISASSSEATQALGGHLAGLGAYLNENHTPVEILTLASPGAHDHSGFGANEQGANREPGQQTHSDSGRSASPPVPPIPDDRDGVLSVTNATERVATTAMDGGRYISVIV